MVSLHSFCYFILLPCPTRFCKKVPAQLASGGTPVRTDEIGVQRRTTPPVREVDSMHSMMMMIRDGAVSIKSVKHQAVHCMGF